MSDEVYAVIFSAQRAVGPDGEFTAGYDDTAARMAELSRSMPGFIDMEHARSETGFGITVCYWSSEEAIAAWKANIEHGEAQSRGAKEWYADYNVRIAKVIRSYGMTSDQEKS
ncbi:MAG: antibiotic biosynthesis monooxygenase [Pseudomonadota bacterium]